MITINFETVTQQVRIKLPMKGLSKRQREVPLEGPALYEIDPGGEELASFELDPADPTQSTLLLKSKVQESNPETGPWMVTGTLRRDGRPGADVRYVEELFALEIRREEASTMVIEQGEPEEQNP